MSEPVLAQMQSQDNSDQNPANVVTRSGWRPLFNCHMHFQSNNCCPLPIMWSLAGNIPLSRYTVNKLSYNLGAFVGRFGKLGRLRSDIIAGIYWGEAVDADMPENLMWVVNRATDSPTDEQRESAGKRAKITHLSAKTTEVYDQTVSGILSEKYTGLTGELDSSNYANLLKGHVSINEYYGLATNLELISVGLLMDLSYGHYWGELGLPVNLPTGTGRSYISSYARMAPLKIGSSFTFKSHAYNNSENRIYAKGLTDTEITLKKLVNGNTPISDHCDVILQNGDSSLLHNREFVHIVHGLPGEEAAWAEEYPRQISYSEGATVRFPLKQFAFYHYDPRRYYLDDEKLHAKATHISQSHSFFTVSESINRFRNETTLSINSVEELRGTDNITALLTHRDGMSTHAEAVSHFVHRDGLFWGIKMYPRLGYRPDDFAKYPHLHDLYKECVEKKVPLLTHCGRGPMQIADYDMFNRYDENIQNDWTHEGHQYHWVDNNTKPFEWQNVINTYPDLKLCFAHFGGNDIWEMVGNFEGLHAMGMENVERPRGQKFVYQQSNRSWIPNRRWVFLNWIRAIVDLMEESNSVYVDLSYFNMKDTTTSYSGNQLITENLAWLFNYARRQGKFTVFKERILLGTDWYMTENQKLTSDGPMLNVMYTMLENLSHRVEFDCWHQFGVLNPMRYLGIMSDSMEIDTSRLKVYRDRLVDQARLSDWCEEACALTINTEDVIRTADRVLNGIRNLPIYTAEELYQRRNKTS